MSRPEPPPADGPADGSPDLERAARTGPSQGYGYGRYMALLALLILVLVVLNTAFSKPHGASGVDPGRQLPPFALPLATGTVNGDADVATRAGEGAAGRLPACAVRGPQILNVCQLYERAPLVLALFVNSGSCPAVLEDLQAIAPAFPGVRFAGVAIKGDRPALRALIRKRRLSIPIGWDRDGALAALYRVASCPQVTLAYPGGVVASPALLTRPSPARLRERVGALVAATRARERGAAAP
jgi:hypothetical protein